MIEALQEEVSTRGITRLCHLTPFRNLVHIAAGDGLVSTAQLEADERKVFNQQDLLRLDGRPDFINCSIEYPNLWYLRQRRLSLRGSDRLFPDWVCLCISAEYIARESTLFCPRNAAAEGGRLVRSGLEAFRSLFDDEVPGARGRTFTRQATRLAACPTDEQAEVLVHRGVPLAHLTHVIVGDESQARRVYIGLDQLGQNPKAFDYIISDVMFKERALSGLLSRGVRPPEAPWDPVEALG